MSQHWISDKKVKTISFLYSGQRPAPRISRIQEIHKSGVFVFSYTKQEFKFDQTTGKVKFVARVWPGEYFEAENFDWAEDATYQSIGRLGLFKVLPDLSIVKVDDAEVRGATPSTDTARPQSPKPRQPDGDHRKGNWAAFS